MKMEFQYIAPPQAPILRVVQSDLKYDTGDTTWKVWCHGTDAFASTYKENVIQIYFRVDSIYVIYGEMYRKYLE